MPLENPQRMFFNLLDPAVALYEWEEDVMKTERAREESLSSWEKVRVTNYSRHNMSCDCIITLWTIDASVTGEIAISASSVMDFSLTAECENGQQPLPTWFSVADYSIWNSKTMFYMFFFCVIPTLRAMCCLASSMPLIKYKGEQHTTLGKRYDPRSCFLMTSWWFCDLSSSAILRLTGFEWRVLITTGLILSESLSPSFN